VKTVLYFYESAFTMWRRRLAGIYAVARNEGWHVTSVDVGMLKRGVCPVLKYWKPAGVIVEGGVFSHRGCSADAFAGLSSVYFTNTDIAVRPYFGVCHNSDGIVKEAVRELRTRNFDDYGYVHYRRKTDWTMEREVLFSQEMSALGRQGHVFNSWQCSKGEDSVAFGRRLETFLKSLPKPCGILAANDEIAVHVLRAAENLGIGVPEEVAVIGIDNDELMCENTVPTLSSIAPDFEYSGRLAAGLLARQLRNPKMKPIVLEFGSTKLVRRHSTRKTERVDIRAVRAVEYVRTNACNGISAADVVREMGLKVRTAENRFREVAGHSIRDEIVAVRIARAKELLCDSALNVNEIYARCGYGDPRSLRAVFTKATGLTLSQWRARHGDR